MAAVMAVSAIVRRRPSQPSAMAPQIGYANNEVRPAMLRTRPISAAPRPRSSSKGTENGIRRPKAIPCIAYTRPRRLSVMHRVWVSGPARTLPMVRLAAPPHPGYGPDRTQPHSLPIPRTRGSSHVVWGLPRPRFLAAHRRRRRGDGAARCRQHGRTAGDLHRHLHGRASGWGDRGDDDLQPQDRATRPLGPRSGAPSWSSGVLDPMSAAASSW